MDETRNGAKRETRGEQPTGGMEGKRPTPTTGIVFSSPQVGKEARGRAAAAV